MVRKIAIVGSSGQYWTPEQRTKVMKKIEEILKSYAHYYDDGNTPEYNYDGVILVSGGCPKGGVDIWAEIVAGVLGIKKEIYKPEVNQWEDLRVNDPRTTPVSHKGYKTRNIEIAEACDVLYCIDPADRKWSGGRWTMQKTKLLNKETHLILIE